MWPFKKKESLLTESYVDEMKVIIRSSHPLDETLDSFKEDVLETLQVWNVYGHNRVVLETILPGLKNEISYVYAEKKEYLRKYDGNSYEVWRRYTPKFWCHSLKGAKPIDFVRELWENEMAKIQSSEK